MNFDPVHPAENVLVWTKYRTAEFAEHPVSRKPAGGGAQARIAQHLSAGAPTSAGLPATLTPNKKNVRGNRSISGQKCIPTQFIRQKTF